MFQQAVKPCTEATQSSQKQQSQSSSNSSSTSGSPQQINQQSKPQCNQSKQQTNGQPKQANGQQGKSHSGQGAASPIQDSPNSQGSHKVVAVKSSTGASPTGGQASGNTSPESTGNSTSVASSKYTKPTTVQRPPRTWNMQVKFIH